MIRNKRRFHPSTCRGFHRPISFRVALFLLGALLAACSGLPFLQPASGTPAAQNGMEDTALAETHAISANTAVPMGGYPLPEDSSPVLPAEPKAITPDPNSFNMFLPIIFNELPPTYPFELQSTGVMAIQGIYGCTWIGLGGQIFDLSGVPLMNLVLHLEGTWDGKSVAVETLSGSKPDPYGPAGYEFILGNQTLDSSQTLWIEVRDATNKAISAPVFINTYNDCTRNLILINFNQIR
jgi:hypothetical protein